ncbi:DUF7344 domain-containing protein [Salinirussus salinus]|jgi:hypothetical protein|uniref:DUF7344 domain-containing protein n=1 Tax=Salinirussus salinus TaxID=1198300 RepID=UPI001357EC71|nr:hypothetical protein [Salinirussus salinus]
MDENRPADATPEDAEKNTGRTAGADTRSGSETPDSPEKPTADELFEALARSCNRYVLHYLIQRDREVSLDELVEYVVTVVEPDEGETEGELRGAVRSEVTRSLAHLESLGFLTYDERTYTVRPSERTGVAELYLRLAVKELPAK